MITFMHYKSKTHYRKIVNNPLAATTTIITFLLLRHVRSFQAAKFVTPARRFFCFGSYQGSIILHPGCSAPLPQSIYSAGQNLRSLSAMNSASEDSGTPVRRSPRKTTKGNDVAGRVTSPSSKSATPPKATKKKVVKRKLVKRIVSKSTNDDASSASSSLHNESPSTQNATKKSPKRKVKKTVSRSSENDAVDSVVASKKRVAPKKAEVSSNVKAKKAKAVPHQQITQRDVLPKLWDAKEAREKYGSYSTYLFVTIICFV